MRVLLISHTYVVGENRKKLAELSEFVDLHLLTPTHWKHQLMEYRFSRESHDRYAIYPTRVAYGGDIFKYFFVSPDLHISRLKPDIIHIEEEPWSASAAQAVLATRLLSPRSKTIGFTWENVDRVLKQPWRSLEGFTLGRVDHFIAGNRDARDILERKGFRGGISVLPQLGVDTGLYEGIECEGLRDSLGLGSFTVGFVGRFVPEKGILELVDAVSELPQQVTLLLLGRGPLRGEMEERAKALKIEGRLRIVDAVPHDRVPQYLKCMDCLVLPSRTTPGWKEQLGHVLLEAMACGVPAIGSSSGEIPNVVGDAGLIFPEGDVEALRNSIESLISEPGLREELARRGRERVLSNFTNRRIAERTFEVYRGVLGV
ncbi:MAG: glycosyltransferase [bacterium]